MLGAAVGVWKTRLLPVKSHTVGEARTMSIADFFGKRPRSEDETANANASTAPDAEPTVLCCWNANSLLNRLKSDAALVKAFLEERRPDILFVSEFVWRLQRLVRSEAMESRVGEGSHRTTPEQSKEADLVFSFLRAQGYKHGGRCRIQSIRCGALVRRGCTPPDKIHFSLDTAAPRLHTILRAVSSVALSVL